jgi:hypothetical protein
VRNAARARGAGGLARRRAMVASPVGADLPADGLRQRPGPARRWPEPCAGARATRSVTARLVIESPPDRWR